MKRLPIILLTFIMFAFPSTVLADIAPPINPPGSNIQPGSETTQVRMVAETVQIEVKADNSLGVARVTADFTMHNLGTDSESMSVRFPISSFDGYENYPEVKDLAIKVNGKQVLYRRSNYPDIIFPNRDQKVPWAEFDVTFPVQQDVTIQVAYNLNGFGEMPLTRFSYVLETGAGWKDTIGSADIILRLPYPANKQNVIMDMEDSTITTSGGIIKGNEISWHFDNFEPGPTGPVQNMDFVLVAPVTWQNVLKARSIAEKNPNDSEAWGQLAKSYKETLPIHHGYRTDTGGEELYKLSKEAYEKCLALNPKDALWHAGFADLLMSGSSMDSLNINPTADVYRALDEIHTALKLAPNDPTVLENASIIASMYPEGMSRSGSDYAFPWLTQTPTLYPTNIPVFDPTIVSGTYQSNMLTLRNRKNAQLILTLNIDHSARLEIKYEEDLPLTSIGSWTDNGDKTISIAVTDPNQRKTKIKFALINDTLQTITYPVFYNESSFDMQRLVSAIPIPTSTTTVKIVSTSIKPTSTIILVTPEPVSKISLPICGSVVLICLIFLEWKRR